MCYEDTEVDADTQTEWLEQWEFTCVRTGKHNIHVVRASYYWCLYYCLRIQSKLDQEGNMGEGGRAGNKVQ